MKTLLKEDIINALDLVDKNISSDFLVENISIDSRNKVDKGIFFAIIGENFDSHNFLKQAIENGCNSIVISDREIFNNITKNDINVYLVSDTVLALGDLAKYYIEKLNIKTIGITGSNGKTSIKDMVFHILKDKYICGVTKGNFNNEIGLPLTALSFEDETEIGIFEMGMSSLGEIHHLVDIARPKVALISNIGVSHLESFNSREELFLAKKEITDFLGKDDVLIINSYDEFLKKSSFTGQYQVLSIEDDEIFISEIEDLGIDGVRYILNIGENSYNVELNIPGAHNVYNASMAILCCSKFGVDIEDSISKLSNIQITSKRLDVIKMDDYIILDDTYNASPPSMISALRVLKNSQAKRRIAVLGDMYELGSDEIDLHRSVGIEASRLGIDIIITIGNLSKNIGKAANNCEVLYYNSGKDFLNSNFKFQKGDVILFKASRSMKLDLVIDSLIGGNE